MLLGYLSKHRPLPVQGLTEDNAYRPPALCSKAAESLTYLTSAEVKSCGVSASVWAWGCLTKAGWAQDRALFQQAGMGGGCANSVGAGSCLPIHSDVYSSCCLH